MTLRHPGAVGERGRSARSACGSHGGSNDVGVSTVHDDHFVVLVAILAVGTANQNLARLVRLTLPGMIPPTIFAVIFAKATQMMLAKGIAIPNPVQRPDVPLAARLHQQLDIVGIQHRVLQILHRLGVNVHAPVPLFGLGVGVAHSKILHDVLAGRVGEAVAVGVGDAGSVGGIFFETAKVSAAEFDAGSTSVGGEEGALGAGLEDVFGEVEELGGGEGVRRGRGGGVGVLDSVGVGGVVFPAGSLGAVRSPVGIARSPPFPPMIPMLPGMLPPLLPQLQPLLSPRLVRPVVGRQPRLEAQIAAGDDEDDEGDGRDGHATQGGTAVAAAGASAAGGFARAAAAAVVPDPLIANDGFGAAAITAAGAGAARPEGGLAAVASPSSSDVEAIGVVVVEFVGHGVEYPLRQFGIGFGARSMIRAVVFATVAAILLGGARCFFSFSFSVVVGIVVDEVDGTERNLALGIEMIFVAGTTTARTIVLLLLRILLRLLLRRRLVARELGLRAGAGGSEQIGGIVSVASLGAVVRRSGSSGGGGSAAFFVVVVIVIVIVVVGRGNEAGSHVFVVVVDDVVGGAGSCVQCFGHGGRRYNIYRYYINIIICVLGRD
mmetsp:Transcript_22446/g.47246  ORF Transcript_22446/g.47246 Transcript_22446/m.47246 type:complete len:605 (+) Transcript_22446:808-2622(+)